MKTLMDRLRPIQNVGLWDRILRTVVGAGLMGWAALHLVGQDAVVDWHAYAMLVAFYPLITALLGWDPFYAMAGGRTCSDSGRNQCGTFPYEVEAALGKELEPEEPFDHSLASVHHHEEELRKRRAKAA